MTSSKRSATARPRQALIAELTRRDLVRDLLRTTTEAPEEQGAILDFALTYAMQGGELGKTGSIFVNVPAGASQSLRLLLRKVKEGSKLVQYTTAVEYASFREGEGFAGLALQTGETVFSNDPTNDRRYKKFQSLPQLGSLACIPVRSGSLVLGVMSIHNGTRPIQEEDIAFIEDLARVSALSIRAYHHEMTMLPTRSLMNELIDREVERRGSGGDASPFSISYLDLDGFGKINKDFNHDVGNQVIKEFAQRLRANVDDEAIVCHLHGDEFAVIWSGCNEEASVAKCQALCDSVRGEEFPITFRGVESTVPLTSSIGVAAWLPGMDRQHLIEAADVASNLAKERGKDRVEVHRA